MTTEDRNQGEEEAGAASAPAYVEDLRLARGAIRGEAGALEVFARRMTCVPRMVSAVDRRMSARLSPEQAADLAQDVLVRLWAKLSDYRGEAPLENWTLRFVFLEIRNVLRRRDRARTTGSLDLDEVAAENSETIGAEAYAVLVQSLDELKPPAPDVVRLRHYEQLTFDQIGERLGMPGNTAKTIYHRSLVRLRAKLAPRLQGEFR